MTLDVSADPLASGRLGEDYRPPLGVKAAYGMGQIVESIFTAAMGFVFFYYTAVLGVPASLVSVAVFIGLCFDAGVDPILGSWSDNIRSRFGRRLPLMFVGGPLTCLFLALLFAPPQGLSEPLLFAWLVGTGVMLRVCISTYHVPYIALGAELATGYVERSRVVAWRTILGVLSHVALTAIAYSLIFSGEGGLQQADRYPTFGWSIAAMSLLGVAVCCIGLRRHAGRLPQVASVDSALHRRLFGEVREIFRNRSFRVLFTSAVIFFTAQGVHATLNTHAYVFVWRLQPETIQFITYSYLIAILLGVPLTPQLLRLWEKRTVVMIGLSLVVVSQTLLAAAWALGLNRPEGGAALPWLAANVFLAGLGVGFALIAYPSMMADAADEHEHLFERRREGLYFSGLGFATKAATGIGVLIAGFTLDLIRFQPGRIAPGTVIDDATLERLTLAWGPMSAGVTLVSVVMLAAYGISRKRHEQIAADLQRRHSPA
jgi:GPH family glycoside/pentoside/hexuronide:cation symporter